MKDYPPGRYEIVAGEYKVERCKIPEYFTSDFWANLQIWDICKDRGLPYAVGWAQHPAYLIHVLQLFSAAESKLLKEKTEEMARRKK